MVYNMKVFYAMKKLQRKHFLVLRMLGLPFAQKTKKTAAARKTSLRYNERINAQGTQLLFDKRRKVESQSF